MSSNISENSGETTRSALGFLTGNRPLQVLILLCLTLACFFFWGIHYTIQPLPLDTIRSASPCVQSRLEAALDTRNTPVTRKNLDDARKACEVAEAAEAQRAALKSEG